MKRPWARTGNTPVTAEMSTAMQCARHKVETLLRCGKCETPICPDCMVVSPAGTRCRDCASLKSSPLFQVGVDRLAVAVVVGLVVATIGGFILATARNFGFLLLWASLLYGGLVGETVLRTVYRKRGIKVEVTAGACAALGMLMGFAAWMQTQSLPFSALGALLGASPYYLLSIAIAIFAAVSRIRFI